MASVNEPADLRVYAEDPAGNMFKVIEARSDGPIAAGFSPEGVLANKTFDKQMKAAMGGPTLEGGWKVHLFAKLDAADGIDASDCVIQIPITDSNGSERSLTDGNFGFTTDLPAATPAGYWVELGSGYSVANGERFKLGSRTGNGPIVISLEDDT